MLKRIFRIMKSFLNSILNNLEHPIKIMEQVICDSKEEIFKLYTAYEEIKMSIKKLEELDSDEETKKIVNEQKEKLIKTQDKLKEKVEVYKKKIIDTTNKIQYLKNKNKAYDAILKIQENLSKFDINSDLSAIDRMEEKINKKEAKINAYSDMEDV